MILDGFIFVPLLLLFRTESSTCLTSSHIPKLLVPCYNGSFSMENKPPLTITLLVELLRKIELYDKSTINMRILTTALIHTVMFDGVTKSSEGESISSEFLPFRAGGHEFFKYKLMADYIIPGESTLLVEESLSQDEICYLHFLLSTTVDRKYRGDEEMTCFLNQTNMPIPKVELLQEHRRDSGCPLMKGNVFTPWGSLTPGHLVYGFGASLENMQITFAKIIQTMNKKKKINGKSNRAETIWISTITSDLAEAILNQATNYLTLGTLGFWNSRLLPISYYLSSTWSDLTESKLIGGIDGMILAKHVVGWEKILQTTRFSQILDMYYSNRGVAFNFSIRASNRNDVFNNILKETNLTEQIIGTANLLKGLGSYDTFLSQADIEKLASFTVEKYEDLADEVTKRFDAVDHVNVKSPRATLEIILILDGTFSYNTSKQIIHSLVTSLQISRYGSRLGIINGENGHWISNTTGEIYEIWKSLANARETWPTQLFLQRALEAIAFRYRNVTYSVHKENSIRPLGRAIVVLTKTARPSGSDMVEIKDKISIIKNYFPETNIIYALPEDVKGYFQELLNLYRNDSIVVIPNDILTISNLISDSLEYIPGQIVNDVSDNSTLILEDYLTPTEEKFYEIYEAYLASNGYDVKFKGNGYGDVSICANCHGASPNETCRILTVNDEVTFNSNNLYPADSRCNLQFILKVINSNFRCTENDCRFPDQVRLGITWTKSGSTLSFSRSVSSIYSIALTCFFLIGRINWTI